ncbi:outer membrane protein [Mesorhizobium xinjiangense]|uniref:outer membrane protein n=1 Tax=Mesorhizobium xinjiangense TaxID=2678685 RepID=UPI0012EDD433|nr:outer membrane protein [Mesorhizobium xinjiangense]
MKLLVQTAISLLGVAGLAAPAAAADYEPPIYIDEAPEYVPVEVGSGWYLRGDITYNVNDPEYDFVLAGIETDNQRFGGTLGIGYHFNDLLRGDVTFNYVGRDEWSLNNGTDSIEMENWVLGGMVNGYIDLGTIAGITPYVGGGIGLLTSKQSLTIDSPTLGIDADFSDRQTKFAYSLAAGASYLLSKNLSLDVGYQYLSSPDMDYVDTSTLTVEDGFDYHQVKVGLRYDLW